MSTYAGEIGHWIDRNTDKLILLMVLFALGGMMLHFMHRGDTAGFNWALRAYDNIQGALLMLLTGRAIARKADNGNNSNKEDANAKTATASVTDAPAPGGGVPTP